MQGAIQLRLASPRVRAGARSASEWSYGARGGKPEPGGVTGQQEVICGSCETGFELERQRL